MSAAGGLDPVPPGTIDPERHVVATYRLRTAPGETIEQRARTLAEMQSTGTWVALPGETAELRDRHAARILGAWTLADGDAGASGSHDWVLRIAYPVHNIGPQIPMLLSTTLGEGASTGPLRLLDLELPRGFTDGFAGPRLGIAGLRARLGVPDRPLLLTMMKPALGLSPAESGRVFRQLALGGVDAVKDDELLVETPWSTIVGRVRAHEAAAREVFETTGHRALSFVNVTDRPDRMLAHARRAVEAGASGVMVNLVAVGIAAAAMLAEDPALDVPVLGHLAFAGAIYESPTSGVSSHLVLGTLPRLAGVDVMVVPGPSGSLLMSRPDHLRIAGALRDPLHAIRPALPAPGGGYHAGVVPRLLADLGPDHAVAAGGAVHGHPMGPAAGARAIRQAIDATLAGEPLAQAAARHTELAASLARWPEPPLDP